MEIKNITTFGWKNAIIGMRLPKNSETQSDSEFSAYENTISLGKKDLSLLLKLSKAGVTHRKFLRMVHVQALIKMPISWWIQYDTYKVGTVANSRSRMHKFGLGLLSINDFYIDEKLFESTKEHLQNTIDVINSLIKSFQNESDKTIKETFWKNALELLPMNYEQERMIDLNYEVLLSILCLRYNEKLTKEWRFFCDNFLHFCPYLFSIWKYIAGEKSE